MKRLGLALLLVVLLVAIGGCHWSHGHGHHDHHGYDDHHGKYRH